MRARLDLPLKGEVLREDSIKDTAPEGFGTFHLCGTGATSWHGFAAAIFEQAAALGAPVPRLKAITTADYPTPARRPVNSVLATDRIRAVWGVALRPWPEALKDCLHELLSPPIQGA